MVLVVPTYSYCNIILLVSWHLNLFEKFNYISNIHTLIIRHSQNCWNKIYAVRKYKDKVYVFANQIMKFSSIESTQTWSLCWLISFVLTFMTASNISLSSASLAHWKACQSWFGNMCFKIYCRAASLAPVSSKLADNLNMMQASSKSSKLKSPK